MTDLATALGALDLGDSVRLTLADGSVVAGDATVIDYDPEERLRVEIEGADDPATDETPRHDVRAERDGDEWTTPTVRRYDATENAWVPAGDLGEVRVE